MANVQEQPLDESRTGTWLGIGSRELTIGALTTSAVVHAALVPQHTDQPLLAASFAAATLAAVAVAAALGKPSIRWAPMVAVALFASLLLAYPVVHFVNGGEVQRLDVGTKVIEAIGLLAALQARDDEEVGFAPIMVIFGVFLGLLLLSVSGGHHHH